MNLVGRWVKTRSGLVFGSVAAVLSLGCSSLASGADVGQPLDSSADSGDPFWGCLGQTHKTPPAPPADAGAPPAVVYAVPIWDYTIPLAPIPGLVVHAYFLQTYHFDDRPAPFKDPASIDQAVVPMMMTPIPLAGSTVPAPVYFVVIPYGANVFLRMTAPGYIALNTFFGGPLVGALSGETVPAGFPPGVSGAPLIRGLPLTPIKAADADNLGTGLMVTRVATDAIIALRAIDCTGNPAAGVTLTPLDVPSLPFTIKNGLPVNQTPPTPTTNSGTDTALAGFAQVELTQDFINLTVEGVAPNGTKYGSASITVFKGELSSTEIRPDTGLYGR